MTTSTTISTWGELLNADRPHLTPDEVAAVLELDRRTVVRCIENKEIPATRLGRKYFIPRAWLIRTFDAA